MTGSRDVVKTIFGKALEIPGDEERIAYVDEACGRDKSLRAEVHDLLGAIDRAGDFLGGSQPNTRTIVPSVTERPGTSIGPYKLREQIGEGGFGVVYVADQEKPVRRKVALKIVKPGMDSKEIIARFEAERQALALLDHPNVAKVLDAGATDSGRPYFVMELVRGIPITELCDERKLSMRERLDLFTDVCRAVQHAHQKGIIHRDLKPSNVMVTLHDDQPVVKVIDFGVSKALSAKLTEKTVYTAYGQMVGTPLYMSPEQAQLSGLDVDTRSDVYSLGVLLYELLTGTTPFDKKTLRKSGFDELWRIIREVEPPRPSARLSTLQAEMLSTVSDKRKADPRKLGQSYRGELDWIVMKALEKDRNRRYESASAFAADVERFLANEPVEACPPSFRYRLGKFARRKKGLLTATGVLILALLVAMSGVGWALRDRAVQQMTIERERLEERQRLTAQVDLIVADAERLMENQNWSEALSAAERADAALASGNADAGSRRQVRQLLRNLMFIEQLEELRMVQGAVVDENWDFAGADREYAAAFAEYGVDVENLPTETCIARLTTQPELARPLAAALDDWIEARLKIAGQEDDQWKRLVTIARGIDPDPLRDRLRASWRTPVTQELQEELLRVATSIAPPAQHPATLRSLALMLERKELPEAALRLLYQSRSAHPADFWLNFTLASRLYMSERYDDALRFLTAAVSLRPTSAPAHFNLGNNLLEQTPGDLNEATASFRRAVDLAPNWSMAHHNLGIALGRQGKAEEAVRCYKRALQLNPNDARAHCNLGIALGQEGKLDEAVARLRRAVALSPNEADAHFNLGNVLAQQENPKEAIRSYRRAVQLDPDDASVHVNLGAVLANQEGRLGEAIDCFRRAIALKPDDADAHFNLGNVFEWQGKLEKAIVSLRRSIELNPEVALAHVTLGKALQRTGESNEAIACFRKAIQLDPSDALAYCELGNSLCDECRVDEGIAYFRKAIRLDPQYASAYNDLGAVLANQRGQLDEAVVCFRRAINLEPNDARTHANLGTVLARDDKLEQASTSLRHSIQLDPEFTFAHFTLGKALRKQGKLDEAIDCYRNVIELAPGDGDAYIQLGSTLIRRGDLDEATAVYCKAIDKVAPKSHQSGAAYVGLARVLLREGRPAEALEILDGVLQTGHTLKQAKLWRGYAIREMGKHQKAAEVFTTLIQELLPSSQDRPPEQDILLVQALLARAWYYAENGDQKRALDDVNRAQRAAAGRSALMMEIAQFLATCPHSEVSQPRRAVTLAKKALASRPEGAHYWETLGMAHFSAGQWKAAVDALEQSSTLLPGSYSFFLAMAHWQLGHKAEARRCYEKALNWMQKCGPGDDKMLRFRAEATRLLELPLEAPKSTGKRPSR